MKKHIVYYIVIAVVVGAAAFYGGMVYAQSNRSLQANLFQQGGAAGAGARFQRGGGTGTGGTRAGGGLVNGQIINKDDKSITIKLNNGSTQFIFFSPSTQILKSDTGTADDLQTGTNVMASGTTNTDGSVTAQMIQIRPAGETFPGARGDSTQQVTANPS